MFCVNILFCLLFRWNGCIRRWSLNFAFRWEIFLKAENTFFDTRTRTDTRKQFFIVIVIECYVSKMVENLRIYISVEFETLNSEHTHAHMRNSQSRIKTATNHTSAVRQTV